MKKLKLSALEFGAKEVLSREQLKHILGGYDGGGGGGGGGSVMYGSCLNIPGCWTYTTGVSWSQCLLDIQEYCGISGEGTCSVTYVCY